MGKCDIFKRSQLESEPPSDNDYADGPTINVQRRYRYKIIRLPDFRIKDKLKHAWEIFRTRTGESSY